MMLDTSGARARLAKRLLRSAKHQDGEVRASLLGAAWGNYFRAAETATPSERPRRMRKFQRAVRRTGGV